MAWAICTSQPSVLAKTGPARKAGPFYVVIAAKLLDLEVETFELKGLIAFAWAFNPSLRRQIMARLERLSSGNHGLPERAAALEPRMEASRFPFECG